MYIAIIGTVGGLAWFVLAQRRDNRESVVRTPKPAPDTPAAAAVDEADLDATDAEPAADEEPVALAHDEPQTETETVDETKATAEREPS